MSYAELLARSSFSLLEGASTPAELVRAAIAGGLAALGIVDRDGVYGLVQAHKAVQAARAEGAALRLASGASLTVRGQPPVSLLVEDARGWANLCRLISAGRARCEKGRSELLVEEIAGRAGGLVALLPAGWSAEAAAPLREAFGAERLGVVWSRRCSPLDRAREAAAVAVARALGAPLVASNQPLFHEPAQRLVADVLACVRRRCTLAEAGRALQANSERFIQAEAEFRSRYASHPEAITAGLRLAERCDFSLSELRYQYPPEVVPVGFTAMNWLRELTQRGLAWRYPEGVPASVAATVARELAIIEQLDFPAYFLTVHDLVRYARERGILCQGRGSAANSAVCYALGVTSVDPAQSSLLFERFLSVERGEPPDIDIDFEHERREEVIQYVYQRYGRERAALVNEVICWRGRSAVRESGRIFGLSTDQIDRLARATDRWSAGAGAEAEALVREAGLDPDALPVRNTLAVADRLQGLPRHLSQHVGGFVIAAGPLIDLVPIEPAAMVDRTVIQWDKDDVDALGFVKVDLLALGILTCVRRSFDLIRAHHGRELDLATIPGEDPEVYRQVGAADTIGVFQIESRAQMSMLPRLQPRTFYDLVIEVSIVRPGPIQGGMVHPYLRRRRGEEPVTYAHPALEPILERTLGVPLFQEQVMQMAVAVGGFSAGQADELRRAMGAWRKRGRLELMGERLVSGMVERGIPLEYAQRVFSQILGFGEYGFPESHAASFALIVYVSAWLKCRYPAAFAASLVNSQPMGFYSPRVILADAERHGVEVRPVCVARSDWDCTLEPAGTRASIGYDPRGAPIEPGVRRDTEVAIRVGLRLVQGLGEAEVQGLVVARAQRPFESLADLAWRSRLGRGALVALAEADALASFGLDRRQAVWAIQGLWVDLPLFAGLARQEAPAPLPAESARERLAADFRSVGLSVGRHPLAILRPRLVGEGVRPLASLLAETPGVRVRVAGMVSSRQRPGTAKGVVFMTLEDETAMTNLVIWPKVWSEHRRLARGSNLLGVEGRLQREDGAVSVLVESFFPLPEAGELEARSRDFH